MNIRRTIIYGAFILLAMAACKKDEETLKSGPGYFFSHRN